MLADPPLQGRDKKANAPPALLLAARAAPVSFFLAPQMRGAERRMALQS
jgi:hypothetical protein